MLPEQFALSSILFSSLGAFTYIRDTLAGRTKPNKVSWFLWALGPLLAFYIQRSEGVGWANTLTFMVGFGPLLIFIASFVNKQSYWKITKFDIACGCISLLALCIWIFTSQSILAVALLIFSDFFALLPTLKKSLINPESESWKPFIFGMVGASIAVLSIHKFTFLYLGFPVYILIADTILFLFIYPKTSTLIKGILLK